MSLSSRYSRLPSTVPTTVTISFSVPKRPSTLVTPLSTASLNVPTKPSSDVTAPVSVVVRVPMSPSRVFRSLAGALSPVTRMPRTDSTVPRRTVTVERRLGLSRGAIVSVCDVFHCYLSGCEREEKEPQKEVQVEGLAWVGLTQISGLVLDGWRGGNDCAAHGESEDESGETHVVLKRYGCDWSA